MTDQPFHLAEDVLIGPAPPPPPPQPAPPPPPPPPPSRPQLPLQLVGVRNGFILVREGQPLAVATDSRQLGELVAEWAEGKL